MHLSESSPQRVIPSLPASASMSPVLRDLPIDLPSPSALLSPTSPLSLSPPRRRSPSSPRLSFQDSSPIGDVAVAPTSPTSFPYEYYDSKKMEETVLQCVWLAQQVWFNTDEPREQEFLDRLNAALSNASVDKEKESAVVFSVIREVWMIIGGGKIVERVPRSKNGDRRGRIRREDITQR